MNPLFDPRLVINRRHFFGRVGLGATALSALLHEESSAAPAEDAPGYPCKCS